MTDRLRRFEDALPTVTHELLGAIGVLAVQMDARAYLVGGPVRDILIGKPNVDIDIAIEGDGIALARAFAASTCSRFRGSTRFGTCKIESKAFGSLDIATTRAETYSHPGALPDVEASDLAGDLGRRDFTVNAMAVSLSPDDYGRLIDPFGGRRDIRARRLRVLHDKSFIDDPTRMFRGVRFATRSRFALDRKAQSLLRQCVAGGCLARVSGKRIYAELALVCREPDAVAALRMLARLGLLEATHSALAFGPAQRRHLAAVGRAIERIESAAGQAVGERWICWFSTLFYGLGGKRARRLTVHLNLPRRPRDVSMWVAGRLARTAAELAKMDRSQAYRVTMFLDAVPPEGLPHLYAVASPFARRLMLTYLRRWRRVKAHLTGGEIVRMGVAEGPAVGRLMRRLRKLRLEGRLSSRTDAISYITSHRDQT